MAKITLPKSMLIIALMVGRNNWSYCHDQCWSLWLWLIGWNDWSLYVRLGKKLWLYLQDARRRKLDSGRVDAEAVIDELMEVKKSKRKHDYDDDDVDDDSGKKWRWNKKEIERKTKACSKYIRPGHGLAWPPVPISFMMIIDDDDDDDDEDKVVDASRGWWWQQWRRKQKKLVHESLGCLTPGQ